MSERQHTVLALRVILLALLVIVALWTAAETGLPLWRRLISFVPAAAAILLASALETRAGSGRALVAWAWAGLVFGCTALGLVATTLDESLEPQLLALLLLGTVIATARSVIGGTFASALAAGGFVYLVSEQPVGTVGGLATTHTLALLLVVAGLFTGFLSQVADQEREEHAERTAALRQELADLGEHLRNVLSCVASGVLVVDGAQRITTYNRAAERILGVPEHGAQGRALPAVPALAPLAPLLEARAPQPPEGEAPATGEAASEGEAASAGEARRDLAYAHPDGSERRIGYARTPLEDRAGRRLGTILVFQDVTLIRDYEERMLRQEQLAALGRMVSGIAHEFGNLLGGAKGLLDLARAAPDEDPGETLEVVGTTLGRALATVGNLLRFARGTPLAPQPGVDVRGAVERALQLVKAQLEEHGVAVERRFEDVPPLRADPVQLEQVFLNLIINAIHAVAGRASRRVRVSVATEGDAVAVTFEDDGPGVAPAERRRIFEPFFTTKGSLGGSDVPGTGLGLAVALGVVEGHGGRLDVDVSPDLAGARFSVRLPSTDGEGDGAS